MSDRSSRSNTVKNKNTKLNKYASPNGKKNTDEKKKIVSNSKTS